METTRGRKAGHHTNTGLPTRTKRTSTPALIPRLTLLLAAACAAHGQQINVGPNVQVSADLSHAPHTEVTMAADPADPTHMTAAAIVFNDRPTFRAYVAVYTSSDAGRTWKRTLDTDGMGSFSGDPDLSFGADGSAYFSVLVVSEVDQTPSLTVFRSGDGGRHWSGPVGVPGTLGMDREYITADATAGKYRGRVYVLAHMSPKGTGGERLPDAVSLNRSLDGGASFGPPVNRPLPVKGPVIYPGNCLVLPDGTIAHVYRELNWISDGDGDSRHVRFAVGETNSSIKVIFSRDGGETLTEAVAVAQGALKWPVLGSSHPSMAVDAQSPQYKGRLYAVWTDLITGRSMIMFSYSADGGKTWARPKAVNDDQARRPPLQGPDDFLPAVAVNPRGVVGVTWYDLREDPENFDWRVRFSASLDGGDTFTPSVPVSAEPMRHDKSRWRLLGSALPPGDPAGLDPYKFYFTPTQFFFNAGHTAGLVADAAGVFHPLWVDNRTGPMQVWTAPVTVAGAAAGGGSADLPALDDLSPLVKVEFGPTSYDAAADRLTVSARIKNNSRQPIKPPIKLRVLSLTSEVAGAVRAVNADNGLTGARATWDLSGNLGGGRLDPGETSSFKTLIFQLTDVRPLKVGEDYKYAVMMLDARVLGLKVQPATRAAVKTPPASTSPPARNRSTRSDDDLP